MSMEIKPMIESIVRELIGEWQTEPAVQPPKPKLLYIFAIARPMRRIRTILSIYAITGSATTCCSLTARRRRGSACINSNAAARAEF